MWGCIVVGVPEGEQELPHCLHLPSTFLTLETRLKQKHQPQKILKGRRGEEDGHRAWDGNVVGDRDEDKEGDMDGMGRDGDGDGVAVLKVQPNTVPGEQ